MARRLADAEGRPAGPLLTSSGLPGARHPDSCCQRLLSRFTDVAVHNDAQAAYSFHIGGENGGKRELPGRLPSDWAAAFADRAALSEAEALRPACRHTVSLDTVGCLPACLPAAAFSL